MATGKWQLVGFQRICFQLKQMEFAKMHFHCGRRKTSPKAFSFPYAIVVRRFWQPLAVVTHAKKCDCHETGNEQQQQQQHTIDRRQPFCGHFVHSAVPAAVCAHSALPSPPYRPLHSICFVVLCILWLVIATPLPKQNRKRLAKPYQNFLHSNYKNQRWMPCSQDRRVSRLDILLSLPHQPQICVPFCKIKVLMKLKGTRSYI